MVNVFRRTTVQLVKAQLWGLGDQALISVTSFATLVVLARELGPSAFGLFAIVYTSLLIANTLQASLVTQPHNVIGVRKPRSEYAVYTSSTLVTQLAFAVAVVGAALVAAALAAVADSDLTPLLLAFVPAAFAWQLQEFARRVLYTEGRLATALANDVVAYGGQIAVLGLLWRIDALDGEAALYTIAATSAAGAVLGAWQLCGSFVAAFDRDSARANWRFGKWSGGATLGFFFSSHFYTYLAATIVGAFAAGVLRAAQVLFGPLNVLLIFLNNVLPIRLAHAHGRGGEAALARGLAAAYAATLPIVTAYCVALSVFARELLDLTYGAAYAGYGLVVALFAVHYFVNYIGQLVSNALYAKQTPRPVFIGHALGAATGIALGWPLIDSMGVEGAVVGMIASAFAVNLAVWWGYAVGARTNAGAEPLGDMRAPTPPDERRITTRGLRGRVERSRPS